jgi:hypothetical protein
MIFFGPVFFYSWISFTRDPGCIVEMISIIFFIFASTYETDRESVVSATALKSIIGSKYIRELFVPSVLQGFIFRIYI